jgi:hypothetical protein
MIKFFRKIRQNLLMENKTGKYFKYAIGEIVLVVIGILIALSINNWNEERKKDTVEKNILLELLSTLESDMNFQRNLINFNEDVISSAKLVIKHLNNNYPYHDSLDYHFGNIANDFAGLTRDQSYQRAKSYGLDFIENDSLKQELSWTYETNTNNLYRLAEKYNLYLNISLEPILNDLFVGSGYNDEQYFEILTPVDYSSLMKNEKYKNILSRIIWKNEEFLVFLRRRYYRMENLVRFINKEIESIKT